MQTQRKSRLSHSEGAIREPGRGSVTGGEITKSERGLKLNSDGISGLRSECGVGRHFQRAAGSSLIRRVRKMFKHQCLGSGALQPPLTLRSSVLSRKGLEAWAAQLVESHPIHQKAAGSIPSRGTYGGN